MSVNHAVFNFLFIESIMVMEPVKGGTLANPSKAVKKLFNDYAPNMSCAS